MLIFFEFLSHFPHSWIYSQSEIIFQKIYMHNCRGELQFALNSFQRIDMRKCRGELLLALDSLQKIDMRKCRGELLLALNSFTKD